MKRCYIAGKIGDLPLAEFMANFEEAKKEVEAMGMIPVSPTFKIGPFVYHQFYI